MPFMQTQHFRRAKALVTGQKGESIRLPVNDACIKKVKCGCLPAAVKARLLALLDQAHVKNWPPRSKRQQPLSGQY